MSETHRLTPGQTVSIAELPTDGRLFHDDRPAAEAEFRSLRQELIDWQYRLYAEDRRQLLVVLQAMDAGGKDGTIRRVFRGVNPQGVVVTSFKVPSKEELAHDFLWRIHRATPGKGQIGVFNRSHYEDVLVVRVDGLAPEAVWQARYEQINQFERLLTDTGTVVLKFFLHISKEEQRERFAARLTDPRKNWKFDPGDLKKREQWDDYMAAYEAALNHCTTSWAPWHVIPSDRKWYRNLAIARVLVTTLAEMDPRFPAPRTDLSQVTIN